MPPASNGPAATTGVEDLLSALPDNALHRVLSFLPSDDVVRTRFLARQWGNKWKDVRCLRVTGADGYLSANEMNMFVNMFLLFSNPRPLHVVEISSYYGDDSEESLRYLDLWVRNCLQREAQILKVHNTVRRYWLLDQGRLSSKHLRVLDLLHVKIKGVLSNLKMNNLKICCLDFSSCLVLEDLIMNNCDIKANLIKSPSLKHLTLEGCRFSYAARARISVPKLVFLTLASCQGRTPIIEKMPWLESAFVRLEADMDCCPNNYETGDCNSCEGCYGCIIGRNTSVLLEALSSATHLELTSTQTEFIFRKDLTQCPRFSMLKTLLLNEWCVTLSLDALRCFLQHSPILEKLTIQFPRANVFSDKILEDLVDNGAIYNMAKEPIPLKHLKVEIIRPEEVELDISISKILKLLHSFGVPSGQIKIQQPPQLTELEDKCKEIDDYNDDGEPLPSARFSFEQQTRLDC